MTEFKPLNGTESMKEIRKLIRLHDCLRDIKTAGKGRTKQNIVNDVNQRIKSLTSTSNVFENTKDHAQFQKIFKSVHESLFIQTLGIPNGIMKYIAEFATGRFEICCQCENTISVLHHDKIYYELFYEDSFELFDEDNAKKVGYKLGAENLFSEEMYFCHECMYLVWKSECGCDCEGCLTPHFEPDLDVCKMCNRVKIVCTHQEDSCCEYCCEMYSPYYCSEDKKKSADAKYCHNCYGDGWIH
eukprot:6881_1